VLARTLNIAPSDGQTDVQTDRRATAYSALSIYAICCPALKNGQILQQLHASVGKMYLKIYERGELSVSSDPLHHVITIEHACTFNTRKYKHKQINLTHTHKHN